MRNVGPNAVCQYIISYSAHFRINCNIPLLLINFILYFNSGTVCCLTPLSEPVARRSHSSTSSASSSSSSSSRSSSSSNSSSSSKSSSEDCDDLLYDKSYSPDDSDGNSDSEDYSNNYTVDAVHPSEMIENRLTPTKFSPVMTSSFNSYCGENDSSVGVQETSILVSPPKKGVKRHMNVGKWKRNLTKKLRNTGQAYETNTQSKKIRKKREMKEGCRGRPRITWEDGIQIIGQKHGRTLAEMRRLCENRTEWRKWIERCYPDV